MNVSIAVVACVLLMAVAAAIRSTKSALFMHIPPDAETSGAITLSRACYVKRTTREIGHPVQDWEFGRLETFDRS
jgi:hypothetical protein